VILVVVAQINKSVKNRDDSYETKNGVVLMKSKRVVCTTTGEIFNSSGEASKFYNINRSNILLCCKHKNSYCGKINGVKLRWEFVDDNSYKNIIPPNKDKKKKEYSKKYCIYKIVNKKTNNVLYVGKTTSSLNTRLIQHLSNYSTYADVELKKYNKKDLIIVPIIDTDNKNESDILEEKYIKEYQRKFNLLNIKIGNKFDEKTKTKIRKSLIGYKHTEKAKANMSKAQLGRKHSCITKEKIGSHHKIKISVVLLNTKEVFNSVSDASKKYNTRSSYILTQCKLNGQFGKNVWVFKTDYDKMSNEDIKKRMFYVQNYHKVICIETHIIFRSMKELSRKLKIERTKLANLCKNKMPINGFHYDYVYNLFSLSDIGCGCTDK